MIGLFTGEFLFHPAMIEISGNTCSHQCVYCFANLRKQSRYMKLKSVINKLKKNSNKTLLDNLLLEGFPICYSNRTDPFSKNNYVQSLAVFKHLAVRNNGIFIQTKGGYGIDDALNILKDKKNIVWYISITHYNTLNTIERNAPTAKDRLILIEKLKSLGYMVVAAFNPLVEEWLPFDDVKLLTKELRSLDVEDIIIEPLHLTRKEVNNTANLSNILTRKIIKDSFYKDKYKNNSYTYKVLDYLRENNFTTFKLGMPYPTELFNHFRDVFGLIQPSVWDVINHCYNQDYKNGYILTLNDYISVLTKYHTNFFKRPFNNLSNNYFLKYSFSDWKGNSEMQNLETFIDVYKAHWKYNKVRSSIQNNFLFRVIQKDGNIILDADGNIQLFFNGEIHRHDRVYNL